MLRLASAPPVTSTGPAGPPLPGWLTIRQAAGQLGITAHAVRARCRRGQLPAVKHKISGEWRIDGTDLG